MIYRLRVAGVIVRIGWKRKVDIVEIKNTRAERRSGKRDEGRSSVNLSGGSTMAN